MTESRGLTKVARSPLTPPTTVLLHEFTWVATKTLFVTVFEESANWTLPENVIAPLIEPAEATLLTVRASKREPARRRDFFMMFI